MSATDPGGAPLMVAELAPNARSFILDDQAHGTLEIKVYAANGRWGPSLPGVLTAQSP